MIQLSREIRFALVPPDQISEHRPSNSWAGWPATNLAVPQLILRCLIEGEIETKTGYLCNITVIDQLLRSVVTRTLIPRYHQQGRQTNEIQSAESILRLAFAELSAQWTHHARIVSLSLVVSPFLNYSIAREEKMNQTVGQTKVELTEQFEFSAAHRLHCNDLSDEENREIFGKCNNPAGHGHNYVIEVSVAKEVDSDRGQVIAIQDFESIVKRLIIDRLDHKHLNLDVDYFKEVNPSVENIAIAIYNWLEGQFGSAELKKVKVFETPKTWAQYCGQ